MRSRHVYRTEQCYTISNTLGLYNFPKILLKDIFYRKDECILHRNRFILSALDKLMQVTCTASLNPTTTSEENQCCLINQIVLKTKIIFSIRQAKYSEKAEHALRNPCNQSRNDLSILHGVKGIRVFIGTLSRR